jgi:hypothetical protein
MSTVMVSGQTSVSLYFEAIRTSTGLPRDGTLETAIAFNTAGLSINYVRERAAMVSALVGSGTPPVTLASASAAWAAWGFIHVGQGLYRVDYENAAFLTGVKFMIPTVTGPSDTTFIFVGLVDNAGTDPRSAAAPDVNVVSAAGQTVNASGPVTLPGSIAAVGSAMTLTSGERTTVAAAVEAAILNEGDGAAVQQAIVDKINATDTNLAGLTLSAIAQAVRDVAIAGAAGGSFGALVNSIYARLGAPAGASMSADIALLLTDLLLVKAKTDNLPALPAAVADIPTAVQHADALLGRNQQGGSNSAPRVSDALAGGLMKFTINPGTGVLTVLNGDGTTAFTRTLSRSALDAIVGST